MYSRRSSFIVGFHGCDEDVRNEIVANHCEMEPSHNDYDWLGGGFYFWENNYARALSFAEEQQKRGRIKVPSVLGAYIDLGNCLDLLDSYYLKGLQNTYLQLKKSFELIGRPLPANKPAFASPDLILRPLDCAIIEAHAAHAYPKFDSVRGVFWEGKDLYPGAGMKEKNHIQICIRNINCIKCFFIPRELKL
ncbi:MAG: hypothetical protein LBJ72_06270 [Dysgonamonadaceae bacterium]|jgi:hypothetical protein|nr:hypothetical protein [Dysgonamonadaceae bacterium]